MSSERQSQVFMTLKELADERLLKMKAEVIKSVENRKEGNVALTNL